MVSHCRKNLHIGKWVWHRCMLSCVIFLALMFTLSGCAGNPVSKFEDCVKNGKYADAIEIYNSDVESDASLEVEVEDFLSEYLESAWENYVEENISKEEFDSVLKTLGKIDSKLGLLGWELDNVFESYVMAEQSKESYQNGMEQLNNGDYEAAMASFSQVYPIDEKNYEDSLEQYENAERLYVKTIVTECEQRIASGDFESAVELVGRAEYNVAQNYVEFETILARAETGLFEERIKKFAESKDYAGMLMIYDMAADEERITVSADITKFVTDTISAYRQDVIDRSIEAYKVGGYAAAIPVISEGLLVLGDDATLLAYEELYKTCIPVKLFDITVLKYSYSYTAAFKKSSVEDAYGNQYDGPYLDLCSYNGKECYIELFLDGKFNALDLGYFVRSKTLDSVSIKFKIYGDGVLLYSSEALKRLTEPQEISLNITNVRTLRLESYSSDQVLLGIDPGVIVVNAVLTRSPLTDSELNINNNGG